MTVDSYEVGLFSVLGVLTKLLGLLVHVVRILQLDYEMQLHVKVDNQGMKHQQRLFLALPVTCHRLMIRPIVNTGIDA